MSSLINHFELHNKSGLSAYALKLPFVGKVRKIDTAKSFTAQRLRHCRLIVRF